METWLKWSGGILMAVAWFFFRGTMGTITIDTVNFWIGLIFLLFASTLGWMDSMKYKESQIISNGTKGSIGRPPQKIGPWAVARLGGFSNWFRFEGDEGLLIVPHVALRRHGENYSTLVFTPKVDKNMLPYEIVEHIDANKLSGPYYLGYYPDNFKTGYLKAQEHFKELNYTNNMLAEQAKMRFKSIDDFNKQASRTGHAYNKEKGIPFLKKQE